MKCPNCQAPNPRKYGFKNRKQRYQCRECGRIFQSSYCEIGYSHDVKKICLRMYLNGMAFRAIERVTGIHHTTIINWVRKSGEDLSEDESANPKVAQLDELQTYVGRKQNKIWVWMAVNHYLPGILAVQIGDRSGQTFEKLWKRIKTWNSRKYLTDGYCVYANYIPPKKHQVLPKTQLTRVESENTRVRHYLARLKRQTLSYSKSTSMLRHSMRLLMHYLRFKQIPLPPINP